MFGIHYMRSRRRITHWVMGKMNSMLAFCFSSFYLFNFLVALIYSGKSMRQFGTGIVDILNKGEGKDVLEEDFQVELEGRKTVVLQID